MRNGRATERAVFLAVSLLALTLHLGVLALVRVQRSTPIEIDDSYAYLLQSVILDQDPEYRSPSLRSLEPLTYNPDPKTYAEWDRNRQHHRIRNFYHPVQSLLALALRKVFRWDWSSVWWCFAFAYQAYLVLYAALFLRDFLGERTGAIALAVFSFSFIFIPHQSTAALREWSNVAFLAIVFHLGRMLRDRPGPRGGPFLTHFALVMLNALIAVGFHTLGLPLVALATATAAASLTWHRRWDLRSGVVLAGLLLVLGLAPNLAPLLGVKSSTSTPVQFVPPANAARDVAHFASSLVHRVFPGGALANLAGLVVALAGLWVVVRERERSIYRVAVPAVLAFSWVLSRTGIDYEPLQPYLFLGSYVHTALYVVADGVLAAGAVQIASAAGRALRWQAPDTARRALAGLSILVFFAFLLQSVPAIRRHVNIWCRTEHAPPAAMVQAALRELGQAGGDACLMIDDEVALYAWILYGDLQRRLSYNHVGAPDRLWRSAWPGENCTVAILPLLEHRDGKEWRLVEAAPPFGAFRRK